MIPIVVEKGVDHRFVAGVLHDIQQLPHRLVEDLSDHTTIHVVSHVREGLQKLGKGFHVPGWEGFSPEHIDALFLNYKRKGPDGTGVYIASRCRNTRTNRWKLSDRRTYAVYHELGHVITNRFGEDGRKLHMDPSFLDVYLPVRETLERDGPLGYFVQDQWQNGAEECFAECFSTITGGQDTPGFADTFRDALWWVDDCLADYLYT